MRSSRFPLILAAGLTLTAMPAGAARDGPQHAHPSIETGEPLPPGRGSVARGRSLYAARCAVCHGAEEWDEEEAEDGHRPPGVDSARHWPAATFLFETVRQRMPLDSPGSLSPDEVYGVVAYILHRNGLLPAAAVLDAATLPRVAMSAGPHFVSPRLAAHGGLLKAAD